MSVYVDNDVGREGLIGDVSLWAPNTYWAAGENEHDAICSGCGTKGLLGLLVPDFFWGLAVTVACDIHDWMYFEGESIEDKAIADRVFRNNLYRLVLFHTRLRLLLLLRLRRVKIYYWAVDQFGGVAFWKNKNVKVGDDVINEGETNA